MDTLKIQALRVINDRLLLFKNDQNELTAFISDATDFIKENPLLAITMINTLQGLTVLAEVGVKKFKWFSPATWDIFKDVRKEADEIARLLKFEKYLKARNIK